MLIHEFHVWDLRIEMSVYDPHTEQRFEQWPLQYAGSVLYQLSSQVPNFELVISMWTGPW